ncbi:hypothetical protein GCM10007242_14840 [Pigmentiphaga litoralis]|uniref:hypothetical protein n=1 Tax=Pigmentiphaga litoralis TaxID=516702 RepID=UPI0016753908|nr:hypothetical protein [Pigmentiphaga litoralis]GGX09888.1 hypothetical protein GCM10007242_14840 [Pigmentiphaga litoralis]
MSVQTGSMSPADLKAAATEIHRLLSDLCAGLPHDLVEVMQDDRGMYSLLLYGMEQAYESSIEKLKDDVRQHCRTFTPRYPAEQRQTLNDAFRIIARQAGVPDQQLQPLQTSELLNGMLIIMSDSTPVAASDDPIHLYAEALTRLKKSV